MLSTYVQSLDYEARKRYITKLNIDSESLSDPYNVSQDEWIDDTRKWPSLEFGDIYTYLIETKGPYTKESLKAFKSLEAYNYYHSGYVRTVYIHETNSSSKYVTLKAKVNPSQKSQDKPHEAWVILHKETGSVMAGHCTRMAG